MPVTPPPFTMPTKHELMEQADVVIRECVEYITKRTEGEDERAKQLARCTLARQVLNAGICLVCDELQLLQREGKPCR